MKKNKHSKRKAKALNKIKSLICKIDELKKRQEEIIRDE